MTATIHPRRPVAWVGLALLGVVAVEAAVALLAPTGVDDRRNFLEFGYRQNEPPTRVVLDEKMRLYSHDEPSVIQVGDSSGLHGVQPPLVEAEFPGMRYLNASAFGNQGFYGYLGVARRLLDNNPGVRFLVLHFTPRVSPVKEYVEAKDLLDQDIWREYNSRFHALFRLPTLGWRRQVTDLAYYGHASWPGGRPYDDLKRYPEAKAMVAESGGWTREHDQEGDVSGGLASWLRTIVPGTSGVSDRALMEQVGERNPRTDYEFDWRHLVRRPLAYRVFDAFRELAETHEAHLVIIGAPVADVYAQGAVGERLQQLNQSLLDYGALHPEVTVATAPIWPENRFSALEHVATPYVRENSLRVAAVLREAASRFGTPPAAPGHPRTTVPRIEMDAHTPSYGLAPAASGPDGAYRAIRAGRDEALLFARADRAARDISVELARDVPDDLRAATTLSVFGEPCERLPDDLVDGRPRLNWRIPAAAARYGGWLEILVSTRGKGQWPGPQLSPSARGPELKMLRVTFREGAADQNAK